MSRILFIFLLFQSFSWDKIPQRDWDIGGTDGVFAFGPPLTIVGFSYAGASGSFVLNSLLICKAIL